jgi:hypothetical protein
VDALRRLLDVPDIRWSAQLPEAERLAMIVEVAGRRAPGAWVVAIGQSAGDGENARVPVAVCPPGGPIDARQLPLRGRGDPARQELATQVLDVLRRKLR